MTKYHKKKHQDFLAALHRNFKKAAIKKWLVTKNPAFGNRAPQELIDNLEWEPLENMIIDIEHGGFC